jgi:CPA1 family monovalent cation:H+ antiporter
VFVTLIARNFITVADSRHPGYQTPILLGWTGMRGVVSLAAALSIPVTLSNGAGFPQRSLILFITFIVILGTLLLQGLTLPTIIARIKLPDYFYEDNASEEEAENIIHREMSAYALNELKSAYAGRWEHSSVLGQLAAKWEGKSNDNPEAAFTKDSLNIYFDLLDKQRQWLLNKNDTDEHFDEDVIRKHLKLIDIEEEKLRSL